MKARPAVLRCRSPTASWIAAGMAYRMAAPTPASHTKGRPPRACLAKKFHDAWAIAVAEAVLANGGRLLMERTAIPGVGELIFFEDPAGNVAGAMQYARH